MTSGAPRCPCCGADLGWGEDSCPYCGTSLVPRAPSLPERLAQGPFPWELQIERLGWWTVHHRLFGDGVLLGRFTRRWWGRVEFLSARGNLYRTWRKLTPQMVLLWSCAGEPVASAEQPQPWLRRIYIDYGRIRYRMAPSSPLSQKYGLQDERGNLLLQIRPGNPFRRPRILLHGPLPLELLALAYAITLVR